jgi:hypothetical protein
MSHNRVTAAAHLFRRRQIPRAPFLYRIRWQVIMRNKDVASPVTTLSTSRGLPSPWLCNQSSAD